MRSPEHGERKRLFEHETPVAVIRDPLMIAAGVATAVLAAAEFICIPLVALKMDTGRVFFCIFFAVFGALIGAVSAVTLLVRTKVYSSGFDQRSPESTCTLFSECVSKTPVLYDDILHGRKRLHHIVVYRADGTAVELADWELKPALTERLGLDKLPVKETKTV